VPKIKTRKGFAKRIRVTKTGKLMRAASWKTARLLACNTTPSVMLTTPPLSILGS